MNIPASEIKDAGFYARKITIIFCTLYVHCFTAVLQRLGMYIFQGK